MNGSVPVFVDADEPAVERALLHALMRGAGVSAVRSAGEATWLVITASTGDPPGGQRVVAFASALEGAGLCQVFEAVVLAVAAGGGEPPLLAPPAVATLGRAMVRAGSEPSGLTPREQAVLRLAAEGHNTAEIAAALAYSERSVKNVLHGVTERLGLRSRCHAVAHAVRRGWI